MEEIVKRDILNFLTRKTLEKTNRKKDLHYVENIKKLSEELKK